MPVRAKKIPQFASTFNMQPPSRHPINARRFQVSIVWHSGTYLSNACARLYSLGIAGIFFEIFFIYDATIDESLLPDHEDVFIDIIYQRYFLVEIHHYLTKLAVFGNSHQM